MDVEVSRQTAKVVEVVGDVIVVKVDGSPRRVTEGDVIQKNEIVITINQSSVLVDTSEHLIAQGQNCVGCGDEQGGWVSTPVSGELSVDPQQLANAATDEIDIAAIQEAILDGVDPTELLEATAAGGTVTGSANAGFVTIEYNGAEVLASTFFETQGIPRDEFNQRDEDGRSLAFAAGGESISGSLVEGSISLETYPQSVSSSVIISAGDLPLDATSFVPQTLSLSSLLTELNSDITSNGQAVSFTYDAAENAIVGVSQGEEVLRIDIDTQNVGKNVNLELTTSIFQPIDHLPSVGGGQVSFSNDQISIQFNIEGKDSGGNLIQAPINAQVTIGDGPDPQIDATSSVELSESMLEQGSSPSGGAVFVTDTISFSEGGDYINHFRLESSEFNTDGALTSGGLTVQLREEPADSGEYLGFTVDPSTGAETDIFTLNFNASVKGQYTFTLLEALDHADASGNNILSFDLPVYAVDSDGDDSAMKPLQVTIEDDVHLMQGGSWTIVEPTLGTPEAESTATMALFSEQSADGAIITKIMFGNETRTLDLDASGEQAFGFTEGTLYITLEGRMRFEPASDLDHSSGDIVKTIVVTSSDFDNDAQTTTVTLTITDGANPIIDTVPSVSVSETLLADGSIGGATPVSSTNTVSFTEGSDHIDHFRLDTSQFNTDDALTSDGLVVQLREEPVDSGKYLGFTINPSTGAENPVFTLDFDASVKGQYTFTLLEALDHADANGYNTLSFDLPVYAVDSDGDESATKPLKVTIADDVPIIDNLASGSELSVDEKEISGGSQSAGSTSIAQGWFETTQGADGVVAYQLTNISNTESGLKSGGLDVTISTVAGNAASTAYQGVAGNQVIFTLELGDDGHYTYTQFKPLDHAQDSDSLTIPFEVVAIDGDMDASGAISLPIEVLDDQPVVIGEPTGDKRVDEDDISAIGSDQNQSTQISGNFTLLEGADGVVEYELTDADTILSGLTSGGEPLEWAAVETSGTTFVYTAQTSSGSDVFTMTFDTSDNSYTFTLLKPLDHDDANQQNELEINFTIKANDYDGDQSSVINLPITVVDDVPTLTTQTITRIEGQGYNGSKIDMFAAETDKGADDAALTQLEGTTSDGSSIVFGGTGGVYSDLVELSDGIQTIKVYQQTDDGNGGQETRQLGILRINSNGEVEFRANNYLEHDGDEINFTVKLTATDGDLDTSVAPLDITITDRESRPIALKVTTFEDAGRDSSITYASGDEPAFENAQDNQTDLPDAPVKVALQVNLYDQDNGEAIGALTLKNANRHHGTFYYEQDGEFHKLEVTSGKIMMDGSLLEQSFSLSGNNTIATIENLYFVPDRNYSTGENGIKINYQLQVDNNGIPDHNVNSNFRIEVESVADIAMWNDSQSAYQYQVTEDQSNVELKLLAETQDISNPETISYQLEIIEGEGKFELFIGNTLITPQDGVYTVSSSDIDNVEINPIDNFSGQIRLEATAVTEEAVNAYNDGTTDKSTAQSEAKEIVIDVRPSADAGRFSVSRIKINEDNIADPNYIGDEPNYEPFTLNEVIAMNPSVDVDGSETLYVRISNITENAELNWVGAGADQITAITVDGVEYFEIRYDQLSNVEVNPELHSNKDFSFKVTGVVKDSATLSDGTLDVDVKVLGTKTVNVEVKGVADIPQGHVTGSQWTKFSEGDVSGIETTIQENGEAEIDFKIVSGEVFDKPSDSSESITVLLSNIPDGVVIEDGNGSVINLNFVGYEKGADGKPDMSKPIYEANITDLNANSGIVIKPTHSSTENITIIGTIVVTENDGHTLTFEKEIRVNVEPVIDTSLTYTNRSVGKEDSAINIGWHPKGNDYSDSDEHFTSITINGVPDGASVNINGNVNWSFDSSTGTITITPLDGQMPEEFSQIALSNNFVQITPPADSSADFDLTTVVEIEERDHEYTSDAIVGEGGRVTATITGDVHVVVRPIVEPEDINNRLVVSDEAGTTEYSHLVADANGQLRFTINSDNTQTDGSGNEVWDGEYVIKYNETDASSVERVEDVVIQLTDTDGSALSDAVLTQLVVTGAAYEGEGRWVIINEEAFSISAPNGLDLDGNANNNSTSNVNDISLTIYTRVLDEGEDTNEQAAKVVRETSIDLSFPEVILGNDHVAAEISIQADTVVEGTEDTQLNLGQHLESVISYSATDDSADEVTIVIDKTVTIDGVDYPISISGSEVDFVNGKFVFQTGISSTGVVGALDGLLLNLPEDYSGDFRLPFSVITTDINSGDENVQTGDVIIKVNPIADVKDGADSEPEITLNVVGSLDANMNPIDQDGQAGADQVGYEDSYIQLNLGYQIVDQVTGVEGGHEVLSSITLTLEDPSIGEFYDQSGNALGSTLSLSESEIENGALDNILFKPADNYPTGNDDNTVSILVSGTVTDTATFNELGTSAEHSDNFSTSVSFDVVPVVDSVTVSGPGTDPSQAIEISGNEDESISLGNSGTVSIALSDTDGSESFVSITFTNVPDGFLFSAGSASGYVVKNNGGGTWSVKLPADVGETLDLSAISVQPPKNFSGTAEFGVTAYIEESLLGVPTPVTNLPKFVLTVTPVGDAVDSDPTDSVEGTEGSNIDIAIDASTLDNTLSATGNGTYSENAPETLRIEVSNVPEDAQIFYPDGTTLATYDAVNDVWTLDILAQQIDKIVFNSGERNSDNGNALGIDGPLHISVQAVDRDAQGNEYLGAKSEFDVELTVDPVNDQPTFVNVSDLATTEDVVGGVAIDQFQIADIDVIYDDPDATYTLTLQVDKGILEASSYPDVGFALQSDGSLVISGKLADINTALAKGVVVFSPDSNSNDFNSGGPVLVTATIDDGGNNGAVDPTDTSTSNSNSTTFEINVTEVNDQPVGGDLDLGEIDEDGSIQITAAQLIAASSDIDGDTLSVTSITVPAEQGELIANLDGVSWTFNAKPNFNGEVTFNYVIEDNGTTNGVNDFLQDTGSATLTVNGVNDAPIIDSSSITTQVEESSAQLISGISVSDVDYVDSDADDLMTVTLSVDYGKLSVSQTAPEEVTVTGNGTDSITLTGSLAAVNALIDTPIAPNGVFLDASYSPADTINLTVVAKDNGNPSGIAIETSTVSYPISVTPVANTPTLKIDPATLYVKNTTVSESGFLNGFMLAGIVAELADANETLNLVISGVPDNATLFSGTETVTFDSTNNQWIVPQAAIDDLQIQGTGVGRHTISVVATSQESSGDVAESAPVEINLHVVTENNPIDLSASSDDVQLIGGSNQDLTSGSGDDRLVGGAGDNTLVGGDGDDVLIGGLGSDILTGGAGMDIFIWNEIDNGATDTITDFSLSEGDKIDLRDVLPELKQPVLDMDALLENIDAKVDGDHIELTIYANGVGSDEQTILVESLAPQLTIVGSGAADIVTALLDQHVLVHDS